MAYIKVNHSKFDAAADAAEAHVRTLKKKMNQAEAEVMMLVKDWQGNDYGQFKAQWDTLNEKESTYKAMIDSLSSYAEFLRYAEEEYKKAQANAVNRANGLPKY